MASSRSNSSASDRPAPIEGSRTTLHPDVTWWQRLLFHRGPHFIARRLRVLRDDEDGRTLVGDADSRGRAVAGTERPYLEQPR